MIRLQFQGMLVLFAVFAIVPHRGWSTDRGAPTSWAEPISNFSQISKYRPLARSVGQIALIVPTPNGVSTRIVCSAIAISNNLVLTARHCFYDGSGAEFSFVDVVATFNRVDEESGTLYHLNHDFVDEGSVSTDDTKSMDYVILKSKSDLSNFVTTFRIGESILSKEELFILHYQGNGALFVTANNCRGTDDPIEGMHLDHTCDTEPGSSGAPIYDEKDRLVGIHIAGGKTKDDPNSFNTGLLLSAIMASSPVLQAVVDKASPTKLPADSSSPITTSFKLDGGTITLRSGKWSYQAVGEPADKSSAMVVQNGDPDSYTLWNPRRDVVFEIPINGGNARSRPASVDTWTDIGTATKLK